MKKEKVYIDNQINWLKELIISKIDAIDEAKKNAFNSMEKRLDGMNEFRDTLKDQAGLFVTRRELWAAVVTVITIVIAAMALLRK